jgi:precorrin-2 dehydrogenase/sirohydrochlorin ferrochelatase
MDGVTAMGWLPVMLRLDGMRCVVVGGGTVAERKVLALLAAGGARSGAECAGVPLHMRGDGGNSAADCESGPIGTGEDAGSGNAAGDGGKGERRAEARAGAEPNVTVVSPAVTDKLALLAADGRIRFVRREYRDGDLAGAALAFAATNVREVNERVAAEAARRGVLAGVADDPAASAVLLPSVVRRGKLVLAVSTEGASPAAARRIRGELERQYGPEYETWLDWLAEARLLLRRCVADTALRQELHRELERLDGAALLASGRLPERGWQREWLRALEREPAAETVRQLGAGVREGP